MKMKIVYEAPTAELVEVRIEKGFLEGSVLGTRNAYSVEDEETWE